MTEKVRLELKDSQEDRQAWFEAEEKAVLIQANEDFKQRGQELAGFVFNHLKDSYQKDRSKAVEMVREFYQEIGGKGDHKWVMETTLTLGVLDSFFKAREECQQKGKIIKDKYKENLQVLLFLSETIADLASFKDIVKSKLVREAFIDYGIYKNVGFDNRRKFIKTSILGALAGFGIASGAKLFQEVKESNRLCKAGLKKDAVACGWENYRVGTLVPDTWEEAEDKDKLVDMLIESGDFSLYQDPEQAKQRIREWLENCALEKILETAQNFYLVNKKNDETRPEYQSFQTFLEEKYVPTMIEMSERLNLNLLVMLDHFEFAGAVQGWDRTLEEIVDDNTEKVIQKAGPTMTNQDLIDARKQIAFGVLQSFLLKTTDQSDLADWVQLLSYELKSPYPVSDIEKLGADVGIRAPLPSVLLADLPVEHYVDGLTSMLKNDRDLVIELLGDHNEIIHSLSEVRESRKELEQKRLGVRILVENYIRSITDSNMKNGERSYRMTKLNPFSKVLAHDKETDMWQAIGLGAKKEKGKFDLKWTMRQLTDIYWQLTHWTFAWANYLRVEHNDYMTIENKIEFALDSARGELLRPNKEGWPDGSIKRIFKDQLDNPSFRKWLRKEAEEFEKRDPKLYKEQVEYIFKILDSYDELFEASIVHQNQISDLQRQLMEKDYDLKLHLAFNCGIAKHGVELVTEPEDRVRYPTLKRMCENNFDWQWLVRRVCVDMSPVISLIDEDDFPLLPVDVPVNSKYCLEWLDRVAGEIEYELDYFGDDDDPSEVLMYVFLSIADKMNETVDNRRRWKDESPWIILNYSLNSSICRAASDYYEKYPEKNYLYLKKRE